MNQDPVVMVERLQGGATLWMLAEDYSYKWEFNGKIYRVWIPEGVRFDGASVPWFLRWVADRGRFGLKAPLIHDSMHILKGYLAVDCWDGADWIKHFDGEWSRRDADRLFFRILREDGVEPRWLRRGAFKLVRLWSLVKGDKWG